MTGYKIGMAEEAVIAYLTAKLVECQKDRDAWENACLDWENKAIASIAWEAKLREALNTTLGCVDVYYIPALKDEFALADTPQDDTALKEYRKKVLLEAANAFEDGAFENHWGLRRMAEE